MQCLNVALLQMQTQWHDPEANRRQFEAEFETLPVETDLIVLPEMFSTGFSMAGRAIAETMSGETVAWMTSMAQTHSACICGSLVIEEHGKCFNRFVWVTPTGEHTTYDKRHLFRMADEHRSYAVGGEKIIVGLKGWRICPLVCYDLRFPVWFRNRSTAEQPHEYDLLLCVANWPAARREAWLTLLRARAIENQAVAVGVNIVGTDGAGVAYSGGSAVYAADGEAIAEALDVAQTLMLKIEPQPLQQLREAFPVWQDADPFSTQ